jgi:hypothetical protein
MKTLLSIILLTLSLNSFAYITESFFPGEQYSDNVDKLFKQTYEKEIKDKKSVLRVKLDALAAFNEAVFMGDFPDSIMSIDFDDATLLNSGKSGAAFHYAELMYPIMVFEPGSGAMTRTVGFLVVGYTHNGMSWPDEEKNGLTITIHDVVTFNYKSSSY